jgi:hypothetical protein
MSNAGWGSSHGDDQAGRKGKGRERAMEEGDEMKEIKTTLV